MNEFILFQSFYTEEEAKDLVDFLRENNIESRIEIPKGLLDRNFIGDDLDKKVYVKIRPGDFRKVNEILDNQIIQNISTLDPDYYLYFFTDEDLLDIINNPDEWSRQDFFIAKKILGERGTNLTDEKVEQIRSAWKKELAKQKSESIAALIIGYFLTLLIIPGILLGLTYMTAKKILPDGDRVYSYDSRTRNHGRNIVLISCLFLLLSGRRIIYKLVDLFSIIF